MKSFLIFKYYLLRLREYILILTTAIAFLFLQILDLASKENIFTVEDVRIEGNHDINFSREKFINKAFKLSFEKLISNILLLEDQDKIKNLNLKKIKNLIYSFKILNEEIKNDKYSANFQIEYSDAKIKKLLREKNIPFFEPKNTTVIFFPFLFIKDEIKLYNENFFYKNWLKNNNTGETVQFILPIENLDDILSVTETKGGIENLDFKKLASEYNANNYAVTIMNYESGKLKIFLKTELDSHKYNENIFYDIASFDDNSRLDFIIEDLKLKILDMWKKANLINIPLPLSIQVKYNHNSAKELNNLEKTLNKIHVINKYTLEKFDINNAFFVINYYGDPKKLNDEFYRFNYKLIDNQGNWELKANE
tara:strand:+ start:389 stop:1486 length:1098 start_codon:yes stop_codon:yes gene_type:complete